MGHKKDISPAKSAEIMALINHLDISQRQIAKKAGVSVATVNRIKKCSVEGGDVVINNRKNCGGKRITTPRSDRKIGQICNQSRWAPRRVLLEKVKEAGVEITDRTLRRRIKELGFQCCRPAKKPRLTERMIRARLEWAKAHQDWTSEDWKKVFRRFFCVQSLLFCLLIQVCFSDESTFQILTDKSTFIRRKKGERFNPDCVSVRVKHPTSIMVWSVISGKGTGRLYIVQGTMRQDQYQQVLEKRLLPQMREWFPNGEDCTFMHDSAPCHKAKSVTKYLAQKNVKVLPWPGNSPDLNPFENLWAILKRKMAETVMTNKEQLIARLIQVWHHDPEIKQNAINCIRSMPCRIKAVIKAKGNITKY